MIMERYHLVLEFWQMGIVLRIVNKKPMWCFCQAIHLSTYLFTQLLLLSYFSLLSPNIIQPTPYQILSHCQMSRNFKSTKLELQQFPPLGSDIVRCTSLCWPASLIAL